MADEKLARLKELLSVSEKVRYLLPYIHNFPQNFSADVKISDMYKNDHFVRKFFEKYLINLQILDIYKGDRLKEILDLLGLVNLKINVDEAYRFLFIILLHGYNFINPPEYISGLTVDELIELNLSKFGERIKPFNSHALNLYVALTGTFDNLPLDVLNERGYESSNGILLTVPVENVMFLYERLIVSGLDPSSPYPAVWRQYLSDVDPSLRDIIINFNRDTYISFLSKLGVIIQWSDPSSLDRYDGRLTNYINREKDFSYDDILERKLGELSFPIPGNRITDDQLDNIDYLTDMEKYRLYGEIINDSINNIDGPDNTDSIMTKNLLESYKMMIIWENRFEEHFLYISKDELINFRYGIPHGEKITKGPSDSIITWNFVDGLPHGKVTEVGSYPRVTDNISKFYSNYDHGVLHGEQLTRKGIIYYVKGILSSKEEYEDYLKKVSYVTDQLKTRGLTDLAALTTEYAF